eukprot:350403-Hanusia_phi.AAC.2
MDDLSNSAHEVSQGRSSGPYSNAVTHLVTSLSDMLALPPSLRVRSSLVQAHRFQVPNTVTPYPLGTQPGRVNFKLKLPKG